MWCLALAACRGPLPHRSPDSSVGRGPSGCRGAPAPRGGSGRRRPPGQIVVCSRARTLAGCRLVGVGKPSDGCCVARCVALGGASVAYALSRAGNPAVGKGGAPEYLAARTPRRVCGVLAHCGLVLRGLCCVAHTQVHAPPDIRRLRTRPCPRPPASSVGRGRRSRALRRQRLPTPPRPKSSCAPAHARLPVAAWSVWGSRRMAAALHAALHWAVHRLLMRCRVLGIRLWERGVHPSTWLPEHREGFAASSPIVAWCCVACVVWPTHRSTRPPTFVGCGRARARARLPPASAADGALAPCGGSGCRHPPGQNRRVLPRTHVCRLPLGRCGEAVGWTLRCTRRCIGWCIGCLCAVACRLWERGVPLCTWLPEHREGFEASSPVVAWRCVACAV